MNETMIMITSQWVQGKGVVEIKRQQVQVVKKGRWLHVGRYYSFDPKTLRQTGTSQSGSMYRQRLERISEESKTD